MNFKVKDIAVLKGVKSGQEAFFEIIKRGAVRFFISRIIFFENKQNCAL